MGKEQLQSFGGNWSEQKLDILGKYLRAYTIALKEKGFQLVYFDAFAGTGYFEKKGYSSKLAPFFDASTGINIPDDDTKEFLEGSAKRALNVYPSFDEYVFNEMDHQKARELEKLRDQHSAKRDRIKIHSEDANSLITSFCRDTIWNRKRVVLFLDPFATEVKWNTLKVIASTKSIDMWLLFPIMAINRMLPRDGQRIPESWRNRIDDIFGTNEWQNIFYRITQEPDLFDEMSRNEKDSTYEEIGKYFISRLNTIFPQVARNPRILHNSKRSPLFLFCFAAANEGTGGKLAVKIAQEILGNI